MLRHSIRLPITPTLQPRPAWPSPNAVASSSRRPLSTRAPPTPPPQHYSYTLLLKGKLKYDAQWIQPRLHQQASVGTPPLHFGRSWVAFGTSRPSTHLLLGARSYGVGALIRNVPQLGTIRGFHATSRRQALPLVPALGALLKGTTLLTLATGLSRVLLSFLPIGTLAMFRFRRPVDWLAKDKRIPKASPDAEEFWKMWCEGEKGISLTQADAISLVEAPETPNGDLISPDGRIAYVLPMRATTRERWRDKQPIKPEDVDENTRAHAKWVKRMAASLRRGYFFLPPLPSVSVRFYNELSTKEQHEVDALRQYWTSLRMFKDRLYMTRWIVTLLFFMPVLLLLGVWATALERVPVTGRWRLILLTTEEEEAVAASLEGANWYKSVINLLSTPEKSAPPIVPLNDWRWQWVQSTLRRLEAGVLAAVERVDGGELGRPIDADEDSIWPPPSKYPLRPRLRASARLHARLPGSTKDARSENMEVGPPYNVMLMDAPDCNAFSYGFGGKSAGGIVIFTGLLDEILAHNTASEFEAPPPKPRGFLDGLFSTAPPLQTHAPPTEEQTLHLAMVLAHEMGHLLLSHHLETLSHQQVLWPSILGLQVDIIRAIIWPFTIFLGPAVNDALASLGRTTAEEMKEHFGHVGFERRHEYEADLVGMRVLAHAYFDPRKAVKNFAGSIASLEEIGNGEGSLLDMIKLWSWSSHPSTTERTEAMRTELSRWAAYDDKERE
ncbi:uncharacterized protein CcaverHIS019_0509110 [Cutaneotrichosporon cavernicola]|uniref:Peptidase M48 domain-containing protein n=1 Tax=Cutaneotrichosporon cavernicola TaxID=279322 RepID=A0AA48L7F8_9TREE|nr:uncharacterized protein CcaverHIS019_0509110 [Cutaneotrichosporon cavernicola]BEI93283.1 hypothetical protein CcaverHIS019_0509110 [Cutaneotrichosporon cavernicola]BEJ01061.1 hypothetical protein CcaverHIS631_0509180 [Cutaneotrichosporon cavernicola]